MKKAWLVLPLSAALLFGSAVPTGTQLDNVTQSEAHAAKKKYYFKDNVAKLQDVKIVITKTKVIKVGQKGNEYGDKPVFAIWFKTKNLSNKNITPVDAWIAVFDGYQDNNKNMLKELNLGAAPDDNLLDNGFAKIKKNGVVKYAVAFELTDLKTPVKLVAKKGYDGTVLGSKTYKVKK